MEKLKIAIIGAGRIFRKHKEAIERQTNLKCVGVCDVIKERAEKAAAELNCESYTDYVRMLKVTKPDIVDILVPSGLHAEIALNSIPYTKNLIIEKPMALRLEDADKLIEKCDEKGVKLFVVKQNRFNLPVQALRKQIEKKRFGKLVLGTVRVRWCRTQEYYDSDSWRGTWEMDGGVLTNQASHHIDLLLWMMGSVESVMAKTTTRLVNIEVEDTAVVILKFTNGALGIIEATTCARPKDLEGSISILGERGAVEIGGFAVNKIKHWQFYDYSEEDDFIVKNYNQNPPDVYGFGHIEFFKDVIESIIHHKKALIDGIEGRKSLELINAIYESAITGKEVFLKFSPVHSPLGKK